MWQLLRTCLKIKSKKQSSFNTINFKADFWNKIQAKKANYSYL